MITLCFLGLIYFLPTLIAAHRGHSVTGILLLNVFLGWTGIGWLALMLWALLSRPPCYMVAPPPGYYRYPGWR
jgi:Superinfection immunity protein